MWLPQFVSVKQRRIHHGFPGVKLVGRQLLLPGSGCALIMLTVAGPVAQDRPYPVFTAVHLDATMKTLGPNVAGVRESLAGGEYSTAKERVIRSREQLATTVTFWRDRDRDDAVGYLRAVLDRMDALDIALSTDTVDAQALGRLMTAIEDGCAACHGVYRERDRDTGDYRLHRRAAR